MKFTSSDSGVRALALTPRTSFEIRDFCEAQNRAWRPWLQAVPQHVRIFQNRRRQHKINFQPSINYCYHTI